MTLHENHDHSPIRGFDVKDKDKFALTYSSSMFSTDKEAEGDVEYIY